MIDTFRQPVSRAKSKYEGERDAKVQELVQKLRDSTQETCSKLSDWGLPGAIELEENPGGVPQSLLDNSRVVIAQGGVQKITDMIQVRVGPISTAGVEYMEVLDSWLSAWLSVQHSGLTG